MRGINNHQKYDFDLYQIEARSPMLTREITLTVDFIEKKYQVILSLLVIGTIWI